MSWRADSAPSYDWRSAAAPLATSSAWSPSASFTSPSSSSRGGRVGALTVSADERNAAQVQVTQFTADVNAQASEERQQWGANLAANAAATACYAAGLTWDPAAQQCVQKPDPEHLSFVGIPGLSSAKSKFQQERLLPFLADWHDFQTSFGQSIAVARFQELVLRFNALRAEWLSVGGKTAAADLSPAADGITDSFADGLTEGGKKVAEIGTYVVAGTLVLGALYLAGPSLIAALRRK